MCEGGVHCIDWLCLLLKLAVVSGTHSVLKAATSNGDPDLKLVGDAQLEMHSFLFPSVIYS